jgi:hypothetical protein
MHMAEGFAPLQYVSVSLVLEVAGEFVILHQQSSDSTRRFHLAPVTWP